MLSALQFAAIVIYFAYAIPPKPVSNMDMKNKKTSKPVRIGYFLLLAAAAAAVYYAFRAPVDPAAAQLLALKGGVRARAELYRGELAALELRFERELDAEMPTAFFDARHGAEVAADRLSSYGSCMKLVYKMAKDKFTGSDDADESIRGVIRETVITSCASARGRADEILARHLLRLRAADNNFRSGLAAIAGENAAPTAESGALRQFSADMAETGVRAVELAQNNAWASAGAAIEAAMLRSTLRLIGSALAKSAARLAAGAGGAAIAAAADGPLPVGDCVGAVIGAGGLGWTAYDIYTARKTMPYALRVGMLDAVDNCRDRTAAELLQAGRNATAEYLAAANELETELLNRLGD